MERFKNKNILGGELIPCSIDPITGFYRNGCCEVGPDDQGCHAICCVLTETFLEYSKQVGNDLSTPRPEYSFAGVKNGDRWCLCAGRWKQALDAGMAPPVVLEATSEAALAYVSRSILEEYGFDAFDEES